MMKLFDDYHHQSQDVLGASDGDVVTDHYLTLDTHGLTQVSSSTSDQPSSSSSSIVIIW